MKRYLTYIKENLSLEEQWWDAIQTNNIHRIRILIEHGVNINMKDRIYQTNMQERTALIYAAYWMIPEVYKLLLQQPDIDITIKDKEGLDFMTVIFNNHSAIQLVDYSLQKKILENGREDILLVFDKYKLIYSDIKAENPNLFKASSWGLLPQ